MMLVIHGHLAEALALAHAHAHAGQQGPAAAFVEWQAIYAFHMPLFFLISGAVNQRLAAKSRGEALRGSLRLLLLSMLVHLVGAAFILAFGYAPLLRRDVTDAAWFVLWPMLDGEGWSIGVIWFLTALAIVQGLAYGLLRRWHPLAVAAAAILVGAAAAGLPNRFMLQTWFPGLAFFALGFWLARFPPRRLVWTAPPLALALLVLAPLNAGPNHHAGVPFVVMMVKGAYGELPLFYVTALAGTLGVIGLAVVLARSAAAPFLGFVGRHSLELLIIDGFVQVFAGPWSGDVRLAGLGHLQLVALGAVFLGAHLVLLGGLAPVLAALDRAAASSASFAAGRLLPGAARRTA